MGLRDCSVCGCLTTISPFKLRGSVVKQCLRTENKCEVMLSCYFVIIESARVSSFGMVRSVYMEWNLDGSDISSFQHTLHTKIMIPSYSTAIQFEDSNNGLAQKQLVKTLNQNEPLMPCIKLGVPRLLHSTVS